MTYRKGVALPKIAPAGTASPQGVVTAGCSLFSLWLSGGCLSIFTALRYNKMVLCGLI